MQILGLHWVDILIVVAYLLGMLYIGQHLAKKVSDETDFYLAGRKLGKWYQFFLMFGGATDANGAVTVAAEVFRQGVSGIWIGLQMMFATPFYWFFNVWFRRVRLISMADLFEDRFGNKKLAALFAVYAIVLASSMVGFGYFAAGKTMQAVLVKSPASYTPAEQRMIEEFAEYRELQGVIETGGATAGQLERFSMLENKHRMGEIRGYVSYLDHTPVIFYLIYGAVVGFYVICGGFRAAVVTNVVQGLLIVVFSFILIPFGLVRLGGFSGLHASVPGAMFNLLGALELSEYKWYSVAAMVLVSAVSVNGGFANMASAGSAKDEYSARVGVVTGALGKRFMMMAWAIAGLIAFGLFREQIADPDQAWGLLSRNLLGPGLIGVMLAGILAANMSSMDSSSICISALFVRNLYTPLFPDRSERHYVFVGRIIIFVVLTLGLFVALGATGMIALIRVLMILPIAFGSVVVLIFLWRRLTVSAIYFEVASFLLIFGLLPVLLGSMESVRTNPAFLVQGPARWELVSRPATAQDLADGKAAAKNELVTEQVELPPSAVYFDSLVLADPDRPERGWMGVGRFNIEVYIASRLGLPVARFSAAALLATRFLVSLIYPFAALLLISWFTKQPDPKRLDRFFVRMKTPVAATLEEDAAEVDRSYENPRRFDDRKLFPRSSWEFCKWTREDTVGFVLTWLASFAVIGLFLWILKIGA